MIPVICRNIENIIYSDEIQTLQFSQNHLLSISISPEFKIEFDLFFGDFLIRTSTNGLLTCTSDHLNEVGKRIRGRFN